jgi:hypothetical protein
MRYTYTLTDRGRDGMETTDRAGALAWIGKLWADPEQVLADVEADAAQVGEWKLIGLSRYLTVAQVQP